MQTVVANRGAPVALLIRRLRALDGVMRGAAGELKLPPIRHRAGEAAT
jgi:hypothetical protein